MVFDYTQEQIREILAKLEDPFDPSEIKWRVTSKSKDKKKGLVAPYADPRAYNTRLNDVLTVAGWDCTLSSITTNGLTRSRGNVNVPTGKIFVTANLTIFGIGTRSSTGEMWADDDNGSTRAEAQAKKRAASQFGLGEYLYRFKEIESSLWVPLDDWEKPKQLPKLPEWALPAKMRRPMGVVQGTRPAQKQQAPQQQQAAPSGLPAVVQGLRTGGQQGTQPAAQQTQAAQQQRPGPQVVTALTEQQFRAKWDGYVQVLGTNLANSVFNMVKNRFENGSLNGDQPSEQIKQLERASNMLAQVRLKAQDLQQPDLDAIFATYQVENFNLVPDFATLYKMASVFGLVEPLQRRAAS